jgi:UDP-glucose 4-epimerase
MRLLVCGGAGYIGAHMCKMLAEAGHQVAVIDDLSTGHPAAVQWGRFYQGNIGDPVLLDTVFEEFKPEAVFHFAARSIVADSLRDPAGYYQNNVAATLNLIKHILTIPGCFLIFSSTAAIYGVPQTSRVTEQHATAPINPYGRSKLMVESLLSDYWLAYQLPSMSFRYFNAAGADASGLIGEAHQPETHLIPLALEATLGRGQGLRVFGTDYPTPDGTCIRDYIHVNDLCSAHLAGLHYLRAHPGEYHFPD